MTADFKRLSQNGHKRKINIQQAGAKLCQAQYKLGLAKQEVRLCATKYPVTLIYHLVVIHAGHAH